jgi:superfamily II DNA or RNA helicase
MEQFTEEYPPLFLRITGQKFSEPFDSLPMPHEYDLMMRYENQSIFITGRFNEEVMVTPVVQFRQHLIRLECSCPTFLSGRICDHLLFVLSQINLHPERIQEYYLEKHRIEEFNYGYQTYLGKKDTIERLSSFFEKRDGSDSEETSKRRENDYAIILLPKEEGLFAKVALRQTGQQGKLVKSGQRLIGFASMYKNNLPFFDRVLSCMTYVPYTLNPFRDETTFVITNFRKFFSEFSHSEHVYWDTRNKPVFFGPTLTLGLRFISQDFPEKEKPEFVLYHSEKSLEIQLREAQNAAFHNEYYTLYGKANDMVVVKETTVFPVLGDMSAKRVIELNILFGAIDWKTEKLNVKKSIREKLLYSLIARRVEVDERFFEEPLTYKRFEPKAVWKIDRYHWNYRFQLFFLYGDNRITGENENTLVYSETTGHLFERNLDFEEKHLRYLETKLKPEDRISANNLVFDVSLDTVLYLINELFPKYASEVNLICDSNLFVRGSAKPVIKIKIGYHTDWFDVKIEGTVGDRALTPEELDSILNRDTTYISINGEYFSIEEKERAKYRRLRDRLGEIKENMRISKTDFVKIKTLEETVETTLDEGANEFIQKIRRFVSLNTYDLPSNFIKILRQYQVHGYNWLRFLEEYGLSGILADDMGLGKTVQALALLQSYKNRHRSLRALIVAPKSLLSNWEMEALKFAPTLSVAIHHGANREKYKTSSSSSDILITTYATLRKDISGFRDSTFDYVVLDEAQNVKNKTTQTFKELMKVKSKHRIALSGTPIENSIFDIKAIYDFLIPGLLGSDSGFSKTYTDHYDLLAERIKPLILRRKKEEVLSELPPKNVENLYVDMTGKQTRIYQDYFHLAQSEALEKLSNPDTFRMHRFDILTLLLRLRQISCHPKLVIREINEEELSGKVETLKVLIQNICSENHKVLVFSQFSSMLELIRVELSEYQNHLLVMTGKSQNRQEILDEFKSKPEFQIFLMTLKVGGVGLNLTEADYVILFDPWWNPASEAQAIDRTHRIGQTKPVFVYRLIAKNSIEEKVLELQKKKRIASDLVLSSNASAEGIFSRSDLEYLFSG